jgi:hypothetical protein
MVLEYAGATHSRVLLLMNDAFVRISPNAQASEDTLMKFEPNT